MPSNLLHNSGEDCADISGFAFNGIPKDMGSDTSFLSYSCSNLQCHLRRGDEVRDYTGESLVIWLHSFKCTID